MERRMTAGLGIVHAFLAVPLFVALSAAAGLADASSRPIQAAPVNPIEGTWVYAKDPSGVVKTESIYEGSTITFGPGGKYSFQLGQTQIALQGTWEVRGTARDTVRVHTEYGQGRENDLTLTIRRNPRGVVVGLVVREGDGSTGARYYVPRPA